MKILTLTLLIFYNLEKNVSSFYLQQPFSQSFPIKQHKNIIALSSSSSSSPSPATTTTATTTSSLEKKAGEEGYSILRQPLNWDTESDPRFEAPKSLDESKEDSYKTKDKDWFQNRSSGINSSTSSNKSILGNNTFKKKGNNNDTMDVNTSNTYISTSQQKQQDNNNEDFNHQEINLFQRTLDTLDYPIILNALRQQCDTIPAQMIITNSIDENNNKNNTKKKGLFQQKRNPKNNKNNMDGNNNYNDDDDILSLTLTAQNVQGIHDRYNAIKEMNAILNNNIPTNKKLENVPLSNCNFDIQPMLDKIDLGNVLDGPDILEVSTILQSCLKVGEWCLKLDDIERQRKKNQVCSDYNEDDNSDQNKTYDEYNPYDDKPIELKQLPKLGKSIYINDELISLLDNAFDDEGRLSGTTFPAIGRLRAKVRTLKNDILGTLDMLMTSPSIKSKVSLESGGAVYSEVNGRIVIPIADKFKNSVGIIHDQSRSGKTAYVEPTEIVRPTNEMRGAEMELKQEEMKVWRKLTNEIKENRDDIERSIAAVAQIDLVQARIRLGDKLEGVVPQVGDEGIISLQNARHPVLLLRELENVVGSDIDIGAGKNQGLVLTGPNSGGKTIILKLMGLCALMARDGIPIPAKASGARVDYFNPVLADIGDLQSVDGDLSTFSGHMLVCREVLAKSGKNALVLMDELGSGTDPNQGVAIAQALLEALLETGSRVAITTHYMELKQLASSDDRFSVGGMQFVKGKPTYKLLPGVVGESFALSVAERLNIPQKVIDRATELLDSETRQMGDLIRDMEDQKALIDEQAEELAKKKGELQDLESQIKKQQEKLERELINARRNEADKFAKKLVEKEKVLEDILEKLKADPSKKLVARSWDEIKFVRRDAMTEAENVPSVLRRKEIAATKAAEQFAELVPLDELREKPDINPGDTLLVCKKGPLNGSMATVVNASGKRVDVTVRGMPMTLKLGEVAMPTKSFQPSTSDQTQSKQSSTRGGPQMSKMARQALADEAADERNRRKTDTSSEGTSSNGSVMRLSSNTVDCLGCNFEEARRRCEDKFSKVLMSKNPVVFILHGHGTQGVLKQKIRDWLKRDKQWVKRARPADPSDGGDAFTMVELKSIQY